MRKKIHAHLDKMADEALAAGLTYGKYVAWKTHPVVVDVPAHLKYAPTMWERLEGATPPPAPVYTERRRPVRLVAVNLPERPDVEYHNIKSMGYDDAPWLQPKRKAAGIPGDRLAELCGVSRKTIMLWEKEERVPVVLAEYISKVLDAYIVHKAAPDDNK